MLFKKLTGLLSNRDFSQTKLSEAGTNKQHAKAIHLEKASKTAYSRTASFLYLKDKK